jgi:hypothetical protein
MAADDMYRLTTLLGLTMFTINGLSNLKQHLVKSFLRTHHRDDMARKLDHLTLMVVSKNRKDEVDEALIRSFEKAAKKSAKKQILAISRILDFRSVFKKASRFKTTQFIAAIEADTGINKLTRTLIQRRLRVDKKTFDQKLIEKGLRIEELISKESEYSGITFLCFNSVLDMLRFKRFINPLGNQHRKGALLLLRTVPLRRPQAILHQLLRERRGSELGKFSCAQIQAADPPIGP